MQRKKGWVPWRPHSSSLCWYVRRSTPCPSVIPTVCKVRVGLSAAPTLPLLVCPSVQWVRRSIWHVQSEVGAPCGPNPLFANVSVGPSRQQIVHSASAWTGEWDPQRPPFLSMSTCLNRADTHQQQFRSAIRVQHDVQNFRRYRERLPEWVQTALRL